jgi:hypothetical protein
MKPPAVSTWLAEPFWSQEVCLNVEWKITRILAMCSRDGACGGLQNGGENADS